MSHLEFSKDPNLNMRRKAVKNSELKDFVAQRTDQLGQSSRTKAKGKEKVRGTIHVIIGTNEDWATSNTKRKTHLRSVMFISSPKRLC
ncbi:hypothetical protein J1N35_043165 [Gossypium stocksii]|uniref:Uncharacterized protein n=1 Tax=Gossypium stocksii TaxID=47602 RepID=A0A9D3U6V6_9ROSI|nr:hypothetical protein J1N35_043165 [Gossypium stocksii]